MPLTTTFTITFGLFKKYQGVVTEDEWNLFLVEEVCPLLQGFSVREELGFWGSDPEPSKVLTVIACEQDPIDLALTVHAIATSYRDRFEQEAVLVNSWNSVAELV